MHTITVRTATVQYLNIIFKTFFFRPGFIIYDQFFNQDPIYFLSFFNFRIKRLILKIYFSWTSPQVLLWSGVTEQLKVQTIPGCAEICPFEDFLRIVKDVLPSDDEYYCRRDKTEDLKKNVHHRSSAACIANDKTSWYIFLTVLFSFTSKFVQKWLLSI